MQELAQTSPRVDLVLQYLSTVDMTPDLILGHNRCFFAYFGRVHPTNEKSA